MSRKEWNATACLAMTHSSATLLVVGWWLLLGEFEPAPGSVEAHLVPVATPLAFLLSLPVGPLLLLAAAKGATFGPWLLGLAFAGNSAVVAVCSVRATRRARIWMGGPTSDLTPGRRGSERGHG